MPLFESSEIRRYYDRQTAGFLALGQGGTEGAIHRAVWGPGVTSRTQAFHFVEDQIAARLTRDVEQRNPVRRDVDPAALPHLVDLGCGIGASLTYLAARVPVRATGITLSPVQARLGAQRAHTLGLADRVTTIEGDFTRLPATLAQADLAFAIESFVHSPSPESFFQSCAGLVRPAGWLAICDDVLQPVSDARAARPVDRFKTGWHVNSLITRDQLIAYAHDAGFGHVETLDLTGWLELGRPRDVAIGLFVAAFRWLPLERTPVAHILGGSALHTCLSRGWVRYELSWFRNRR